MKRWFTGFYIGLVVGTIFEIISFTFSHVCQLIFGGDPVERCRIFVIEFHWLALSTNIESVRISYIVGIAIVLLSFGIFGGLIGWWQSRKRR